MAGAFEISETPKPKDLIKVADKISARLSDATELQMFGYELLEEDAVLQAQRDTVNKGLREFCLKLLQKWKGSKANPTWDDVIRALREIEQRELAQMIEKARPQQDPGKPDSDGQGSEGKYAGELKAVGAHYQALMKLNADAILPALLSAEVITFAEKPVFGIKQLQQEKMEHLIDNIIVPSLQVGTIEKFNGLLEVMEDSDDTTINAIGKSIRGSLQ